MFQRVLIANRGEIALRIIRSLKKLEITSILVASKEDRWALPARNADEVVYLGDGEVAETYLNQEKILQACLDTGAQALHPGYGFLSENPEFAEKVEAAGIAFLGPTAQQIRDFGVKHLARAIAQEAKVPLLTGSEVLEDYEAALEACRSIGYPVLLKSSSGGGGIGMEVVQSSEDLQEAWDRVTSLAAKNFSSAAVFAERFLAKARHIEVQIFGDGKGKIFILGDRDCSLQRRNQKVIEECPAPDLSPELRASLHADARRLAESVNYRSAGTLEFLYDPKRQEYYFLEMNTRLQVEHTVTEEVFALDLVEAMIRLGAGESLQALAEAKPQGHAVQLRLYAEDPGKNFLPTTGLFSAWSWPEGLRLDSWVEKGSEISARFDPLLAKIILHGADRESVLKALKEKLEDCQVQGPQTNLALLKQLLSWKPFLSKTHHTKSLNSYVYENKEVEVISAGMQTTLQDLPGRLGYWDVGIPPSGPMDNDSHRLANSLLDNPINAAALEMTYSGAKLNFRSDTVIALTGAPMKALLDDQEISFNQAVKVKAGGILSMGKVQGFGQRSYLAVQGGFDAPLYLGSASTFTLGGFGGLQGRALLPGDILPFGHQTSTVSTDPSVYKPQAEIQFPQGIPLSDHWRIRVLIGPHGAPEYFLPEDMDAIFGADWTVNFNSSRTGVRLDGPKPQWARQDGGEAGLHPSNIHDNAYAIGSLDFTGDMPVILGPDGPSLGGFVCPAVVISRDLWILGQLKAGDRIRFVPVGLEQALGEEDSSKKNIKPPNWRYHKAVIHRATSKGILPQWELRRQGDANLLLEIGPMKLDLTLRFLIQGLLEILKAGGNPGGPDHLRGIIDLTPGIRSLQIHYDPRWLSENLLITFLSESMEKLAHMQDFNVPSRIVHLPLSWDDPATQLAIQRYLQGVRPNAPWGPSNIEFIRRINGLKDEKAVQDILFSSHYLVLGLGDVYLGAPVATPMDPRQRLVTTKYNPARTWTPENAVGIGGAYLCVYGMEGPGGYQFVGRTLQMWNRHHVTEHFPQGKPWLLNFFDQLKFYPVSQEELLDIRRRFPLGEFPLKVEETSLNFHQFQLEQSRLIQAAEAFTQSRSEAYAQERQRWVDQGLDTYEAVESQDKQEIELQDDWEVLESPMGGSIWKILCSENEDFASEAPLLVLESMKMEVEIPCENAGNVKKILVAKGQVIKPGDPLIAYKAKT